MAKRVLEVEMRGRDRMGDKVSKNASHFQKLGRTILAAGGAYVSFRMASRAASAAMDVMTDALKHGIAEAIAYEDAQLKIAQAMKAGGVYTQQNYELVLSYASALQKTTIYTENEILAAEAMLATFKLQPDVLREALGLTLDMAAATGQDLVQASVILGKAAVGVTGSLSRYGVVVDQADLKTRGFAAVVDEMNKNFGGTAQALVSGYAGQLGMLSKAWDDVTKAVAENITKSPEVIALFQTMTTEIDSLTKSIGDNSDLIEQVISTTMVKLIDTLNTLGPVIQGLTIFWNLLQIAMFTASMGPYGAYKSTQQFNDLWDAIFHGQEKLKAATFEIQRMTDSWKLNTEVAREVRDIRQAEIEQLPELIKRYEELTEQHGPFYHSAERSAEVILTLKRRIADLTATMKDAAGTPTPSFIDMAIRPEHAEGLGAIMRDLATAGLKESAAKWDEYWEARLEVSQELSAQLKEDRDGYWGTEFEAIEASKERWQEWGLNIDQINEWVANRQKELVIGVAQEWTAGMSSAMATLAEGAHVSANVARRSAQLQALVDTYASANAAYKAMAGIPVVGPILAITAAAAAVAAGLANVKKIEKQKFGLGGWIGGFGGGDRELFYGSPGEFVVRPGPARANAGPLEDMNRGGVPAYNPRQTTVNTELTINVTGFAAQDILESAQHGPIREAFQEAFDRQYITVKELVQ